MRQWFGAIMVSCLLAGVPWVSGAQEKTPPQEAQPGAESAVAEDTKFQESLNSLGLSAGYAGKCQENTPETVETILQQGLEIANELTQLFGTDAAFRFVFYVGLGMAGSKIDLAKCPQYLTDWTGFVKKHPELAQLRKKEKK
jgi:hypothetical protein